MIAIVNIDDVALKVSVGAGRQSFKWLAQVVQLRILNSPSLMSRFDADNILVVGIRNSVDQLINPMDCLYEHQTHNVKSVKCNCVELVFRAEVVSEFQSDKWGNPIYNDWLHAAYMVSDTAKKWSYEMQRWHAIEQERSKGRDKADDDDGNGEKIFDNCSGWNSDLKSGSSLIDIGGDQFSSADVKNMFDLDWCNIKFNWLHDLNISARISIHDFLQQNYQIICHLFLHYCGVGKVGQRFGMTLREFDHLLIFATKGKKRECSDIAVTIYKKILGESTVTKNIFVNERVIHGIGHDVVRPKDERLSTKSLKASDSINLSLLRVSTGASNTSGDNNNDDKNNNNNATTRKNSLMNREIISDWPLLSRSAFTECLMCYAVDKELGPTIPDAIENFFLGPLTDLLLNFRENYLKYTEYDSTTVKESYHLLRHAFLQKASLHPKYGPTINYENFKKIVNVSKLLSEADEDIDINICETAFLSSLLTSESIDDVEAVKTAAKSSAIVDLQTDLRPQRKGSVGINFNIDIDKGTGEEGKGDEVRNINVPPDSLHDGYLGISDEIVFTEFVEALAQIALLTMKSSREITNSRKIRLCFSFIVEHDHESFEDHRPVTCNSFTDGTTDDAFHHKKIIPSYIHK